MISFTQYLENQTVVRLDIELLLPEKANMETAVHSLSRGQRAFTKSPIHVYKVGDKYLVADGHHRLLEAIIAGEASVPAIILPNDKPLSTKGTVELDFYDGDFYGLDSSLSNGWLIKRLR